MKQLILSLSIILCSTLYSQVSVQELLKCNFRNRDVAAEVNVKEEMDRFNHSINWDRRDGWSTLEEYVERDHIYPNIHPHYRHLSRIINHLDLETLLNPTIGYGAGRVPKFIYAQNKHLKITCVDPNSFNRELMRENFQIRTDVIPPNIRIPAAIKGGACHNLSQFEDNSFDMVFTCQSMMHLPFIAAVHAAKEMARVSKKYVLHIENKNVGPHWYNRVISKPASMHNINYQAIDYEALYRKLGFESLINYEYKDPYTEAIYICYLGKKK